MRVAVRLKRQLRHRWQITRDPETKAKFNHACRITKKLISKANNDEFANFLLSLGNTRDTNYSLYKVAKAARKPRMFIPPIRSSNGSWARTDLDKANILASHLAATFKPHDILSPLTPNPQPTEATQVDYFAPMEIKSTVAKMSPYKAPGIDNISTRILKELPKKAFCRLAQIYNAITRLRHYPSTWKTAKIIPLIKPGKPAEEPASYRPISLLPTLSKLFEKLLHKRILKLINKLNVLPDHQFGFRGKHAAIEQVSRVVSTIRGALERKEYCPGIFLDVSQAFDRVWIEGLLHKLSSYLPEQYITLLSSYLNNREFIVHYGEAQSDPHPILAGVPQGSVLGPLLYLLYTADLPIAEDITPATFADDTAILVTSPNYEVAVNKLQNSVERITEWAQIWKIKINSAKTARVDFTLRSYSYIPITIEGQAITASASTKYLGIHLDNRLTWQKHISTKRDELKIRFRSLFWLMRGRSKLNLYNKRLLYITVLRPIWSYGLPIWGYAADSNIQRLQALQNIILRKMAGAPYYITNATLHNDLQIETVRELVKRFTQRFENRMHEHPNTLALQLLEDPPLRRLKRRMPLDVA